MSWSSIVKTATGTSGAMMLEMDETDVDGSVVVAVARLFVASDGIGIVVE